MKTSLFFISTLVTIALIFSVHARPMSLTQPKTNSELQSVQAPEWFVIEGLVENPLNLTYAELRNFPLLSEVTTLECAGSGGGVGWGVTYNWTGVPLFYLLSMAKVVSGTYREVVFYATDGFSSSVLLKTAMDPTSILALEANGTDLEQMEGFGSGYRVVFPCRWGYKWVKGINQIVVVDYDYKGRYEQVGYSDEAIRPNCAMPSTNPPIQTFDVTILRRYIVQVLSNSSIESFSFDHARGARILNFNVNGPEKTSGYFYVKFSRELLAGPYQVYVDQNPTECSQTDADGNIYLYFTYTHSTHTIEIEGTPSLLGDVNYDGIVDMKDIYIVIQAFGSYPGHPKWNLVANINKDNRVDMKDIYLVITNFGKTL